jgi:hypothetical protein
MYILAEIVLKSYKPAKLEVGMWFVQKFQTRTRWEHSEVFELQQLPQNEQEFIDKNGYPVEPYIIGEDDEILAEPDEIGWWDEGEETDEYREITLRDINFIINEFDGQVAIEVDYMGYDPDIDEEGEEIVYPEDIQVPVTYDDKVVLSMPSEEWYEDDYLTDADVWEHGEIVNTVAQSDEKGPFLEHWVKLDEEYFIVLTDTDNQLLHPDSEAVIIPEEI